MTTDSRPIRIGHVEATRRRRHWSIVCRHCGQPMRIELPVLESALREMVSDSKSKHRHTEVTDDDG